MDELDGIRLYNSFAHAVNGGTTNAIALAVHGNDISIEVTVKQRSASGRSGQQL